MSYVSYLLCCAITGVVDIQLIIHVLCIWETLGVGYFVVLYLAYSQVGPNENKGDCFGTVVTAVGLVMSHGVMLLMRRCDWL